MEELYVANTIFALNFFKHLANTSADTQNLLFCPWSISVTMAMVYLGARGSTADQIAQVLQFSHAGVHRGAPATPRSLSSCDFSQQTQRGACPDAILQAQAAGVIHSAFHSLSNAINVSTGEYLLESANKLFGEKSARFKERVRIPLGSQGSPRPWDVIQHSHAYVPSVGASCFCCKNPTWKVISQEEYMELSEKYYSTEPQAVDFLECAEDARKKINSWVKTQTKGKIPNLLPEGYVDADTKMVLVNAIYFKGRWKTPFQKKLKGLYPFRVNSTQRKSVEMMFLHEKLNIGYIADLKVQILELPYAGEVSMFLLLPDGIAESSTGLELLESEITHDKLSKWLSEDTMGEDDVEVYIPKFKLEERYGLKTILTSMGMGDAFSQGRANFSGMSEKNDLFLSEVFHQASVDVNEEGTEAAAGTGAIVTGRTGHGGPQFVADHPFLFLIMHKITKSILFWGRFASP
ncbi:plasminogen activator inhibitor 2 isoform X1 [Ovis aries]|uniref:plasminogen activator inhibitor 2 isoform X1 n=1 Tax=Ovis aries TaxID=9940 RepID=UPI001C2EDE38|nr:plasminogen activator inhibitor 2 isoform X1 [Ovis aries]XP_042095131.1 plasminogen activator inhibitor 2 isoform X1 [Ovis aries]XP_042095132.1 plasminogen activator inhibitor 2 isoform X1 [Ovis aries]XP_042095133.1 plasminogen activator inhibitor 2 isoform X1 [Ovis aries]